MNPQMIVTWKASSLITHSAKEYIRIVDQSLVA